MTSLYNITKEISGLDTWFNTGEYESEDELKAKQGELIGLLKNKTDGCVEYYRHMAGLQALASERIKELQDYKRAIENKMVRFNDYVQLCMYEIGEEELQGQLQSIKFRKASKVVTIEDENKIPLEFCTFEKVTKINKTAIKTALKEGAQVPGACLEDGKKSLVFGLRRD